MKKRNLSRKDIFDKIYAESTERRRKEIISEKGASLWLSTLAIKQEGYSVLKTNFLGFDADKIRISIASASGKMCVWRTF